MGFRVSWIARSNSSDDELLSVACRRPTGERHECADVGWYLLELPGENHTWSLLTADGTENFMELNASQAQSLSKGKNETYFFWCSDTVMATELFFFKDGNEVWSIQYASEDKLKQPKINGPVPQVVHKILDELRAKQQESEADFIYDLTAEVGRTLVGFRHDMEVESDDPEPFQLLGPITKQRARWQFWKR